MLADTTRSDLPLSSIQSLLSEVENRICDYLASDFSPIRETIAPFIKRSGKKIRPALVLLSAGATGSQGDDVIRYAILTELIHTASLFHDDVLDDASIRRGFTSSNRLLGNDLSILAGDYLFTKALALVISDHSDIQHRVNSTVIAMTEGEILQAMNRYQFPMDRAYYMQVIERKTAALMEMACRLGAGISGTDQQIQALCNYGKKLGLAYQITDDLLDWISKEPELGKNVFQDIREGRATLPIHLLHETLPETKQNELKKLLDDPWENNSDAHFREFVELMFNNGIVDQIRQFSNDLSDDALSGLDVLPPSPELQDMKALVPALVNRIF